MATATRRKTARTAANRRPVRRSAPRRAPQQHDGLDTASIVTWAAFAFVGLVIAAGVAAIVADDIPYEDRRMRDVRLRLRDRALETTADAIDSLRRQFMELQGDVQKRIAHIR